MMSGSWQGQSKYWLTQRRKEVGKKGRKEGKKREGKKRKEEKEGEELFTKGVSRRKFYKTLSTVPGKITVNSFSTFYHGQSYN